MPAKKQPTLDVKTRRQWRAWLEKNHDSVAEIWLVFHKRHTGKQSIEYDDAVEEALCFGWVDSLIKRLDDDRYARKFTPRKADSRWSTINRERYARMKKLGLLAPPGIERPPTDRDGDAPPRRVGSTVPAYIQKAFKSNEKAWTYFEQLAPSHRRNYILWIDSAKREETKRKRLHEAIKMLATGQKLGIK